ncbi:nucleotidyl transferase AbiEii/AbiGii toxin family protein [Marinobacter sp. GN3S48]|uniref:nucleotidyl transferase AbiEii/AbiGii toxin family protein n=1 Tax=Marinobacter sp. GN3S48 TaxID=3382302 RepID=UPI00387AB6E4
MTELKLDSGSIDPIQLRTYEAITRVATERQVPFIIVGASARDLVMHHGYGASVQRATRDIDLAIQVPDWEGFDSIRESLIEEGYTKTDIPHRLYDSQGIPLDIIPFGPLKDTDSKIAWPPDGDVKMVVMGFQEALENAVWVIVDRDPALKLPVASPQGLALLKLIAWFERDAQTRKKDAADLAYLATNYENIPGLLEQLYLQHDTVLEAYDWDTRLCGAHVFGLEIAQVASASTLAFLKGILDEDRLADMERDGGLLGEDASMGVLAAFRAGLVSIVKDLV